MSRMLDLERRLDDLRRPRLAGQPEPDVYAVVPPEPARAQPSCHAAPFKLRLIRRVGPLLSRLHAYTSHAAPYAFAAGVVLAIVVGAARQPTTAAPIHASKTAAALPRPLPVPPAPVADRPASSPRPLAALASRLLRPQSAAPDRALRDAVRVSRLMDAALNEAAHAVHVAQFNAR